MIGGNVTKLRNPFANTIVVFLMILSVSAVLAVFLHSILFMPAWVPAWASIVLGMSILLFITMLALEYTPEKNDD